jgi:hypothetical protein
MQLGEGEDLSQRLSRGAPCRTGGRSNAETLRDGDNHGDLDESAKNEWNAH